MSKQTIRWEGATFRVIGRHVDAFDCAGCGNPVDDGFLMREEGAEFPAFAWCADCHFIATSEVSRG